MKKIISAKDLMNMWFRIIPTKKPYPDKQIYQVEYYCDSNNCPVRIVQIEIKYPDDFKNKMIFKCPICRKKLKFHHFLKTKSIIVKKVKRVMK